MNATHEHADAFDTLPQYSRLYPGRYSTIAISQLDRLRDSNGYVPRFAAIPDDGNAAIAARRSWEGQLWVPPGSIIWAIAGYSEQTEGFRLQLTDAGTGERFYQQPMRFAPAPGDAIASPLHILPEPRLVLEPGLITAQLQNLSGSESDVQVVIHYCAPVPRTPNEADLTLQADALMLRTLRQSGILAASAAGISTTSSGDFSSMGNGSTPWLQMPPNGLPFREAGNVDTPAAGSTATVLSFRVPTGFDAAIRAICTEYNFAQVAGEGSIIWRLKIDGAYVKGYDQITTTIGSLSSPAEIQGAIRASSGQLVEMIVEHASTSALPASGTKTIGILAGWIYPKA